MLGEGRIQVKGQIEKGQITNIIVLETLLYWINTPTNIVVLELDVSVRSLKQSVSSLKSEVCKWTLSSISCDRPT